MPTVLLAGAFGQGNPGDEAHLRSFLEHFRDWKAVVTSSDPEGTEEAHACNTVSAQDIAAVANATRKADAVVFPGGTIFKTLHPAAGRKPNDLLRKGLALATGARALGKPVAMLGVGVGELDGVRAKRLARSLVRRADLLILRDEESGALLTRAGVTPPFRIGADPAWTLLPPPGERIVRGDDVVVALSHVAGGSSLASTVASALAPLVEDGIPVKLQPWQPQDAALAAQITRVLDADVVAAPADLWDARSRFAMSRLVVGLRYHSLIASASARTPFVAFAHEAKLAAISRRLDQPAVVPSQPPEALTNTIRMALDADGPRPDAVAAEVEASEEGFRLVRLLLDGGNGADPADVGGLALEPAPETP
jgi:polysaccharide pyruvyl transferase WcaK-like protein